MRFPARAAAAAAVLAALLGAAACAPRTAGTTHAGEAIGRTAGAGFGTIVSMRPLVVQAQNGGSNDVRGNILGAIGGASVGGVAGNAVETRAVEFIIREDTGGTVSVVQTNEADFQPGERIVLTRGARTRLARGAPPPPPGT